MTVQLVFDFVDRTLIFSIKPKYAEEILAGRKTVELRRRFAGETLAGSTALIYSSSPAKKLVAFAKIESVDRLPLLAIWKKYGKRARIDRDAFDRYFEGLQEGYAIVLTDVHELEISIPADELKRRFGFRPPQSYGYVSKSYRTLFSAS